MKGFRYGHIDKDYIEQVDQGIAQLSLLGKGDGTEVMVQEVEAGEFFGIEPYEQELMEFFYIIEGKLIYVTEEGKENKVLKKGEYFYTHNLNETVNFKTVKKVKLLYISTCPMFKNLSNYIKELYQIARKVEEKDVYTNNHLDRVKYYAAEIGNRLGIPRSQFEKLCYAAMFHDIGKTKVPEKILKKPDKLTEKEMKIIKKHPVAGKKMVEDTFLEDIGQIIEQHHERVDGSGYPCGLKGEEILIEAKIIGIADAFDAMTTDRPYRKGMNPEIAFNKLKESNNKYNDKEIEEIMNIFEEILKNDGVI
ncbi:MAG: HD domain-containing phosphohydrolase [bacterium]